MSWKDLSYTKKGMIIGGLVGLFIWLYDYDFLLNFGGPSANISRRINEFFSLHSNFLIPMIVLIIGFLFIGTIIGWIVGKIRKK